MPVLDLFRFFPLPLYPFFFSLILLPRLITILCLYAERIFVSSCSDIYFPFPLSKMIPSDPGAYKKLPSVIRV